MCCTLDTLSQCHIPSLLCILTRSQPSIIYPLSLHDALPISIGFCRAELGAEARARLAEFLAAGQQDRKSTRLNSSHLGISYAVFCLIKKKIGRGTYIYIIYRVFGECILILGDY